MNNPLEVIRPAGLKAVVGISKSRAYELMKLGRFPAPLRLSDRAVGWRRADLERWLSERPTAGAQG